MQDSMRVGPTVFNDERFVLIIQLRDGLVDRGMWDVRDIDHVAFKDQSLICITELSIFVQSGVYDFNLLHPLGKHIGRMGASSDDVAIGKIAIEARGKICGQ